MAKDENDSPEIELQSFCVRAGENVRGIKRLCGIDLKDGGARKDFRGRRNIFIHEIVWRAVRVGGPNVERCIICAGGLLRLFRFGRGEGSVAKMDLDVFRLIVPLFVVHLVLKCVLMLQMG